MNSKITVRLVSYVLIIIFAIYLNTNIASVYSYIGDFYHKHNNIEKSLEFYEKAFDAGYTDKKARDTYINSILLTPLDITMQRRLIKFLEYQIDDEAEQKVKYFLYNLKEEINSKYPDNYIMQAPFNQKIVRWGYPVIKYGFNITESIPEYYVKEIENALSTWQKILNSLIVFERDDNIPDITVNFVPFNDSFNENYKYVVAYTMPEVKRNRLEKVNINFYITDPKGNYHSQNKVYNVALHEMIHALGIYGHSYEREDIMSLNRIGDAEESNSRVSPTSADIMTLKLLYKIQPDITNSNKLKGEYLSAIVLGNQDDIITAKKIEAKNYVLDAPNLPSGYVDLAASYLDKKDYLNAVKNLERALDRSNTADMKSIVYYNLGLTYYAMSHFQLAEEYLIKAQQLHNTEEVRAMLAQVYVNKKQVRKAENLYKELLLENPDNDEYVICLTNIYINKKNYIKARQCLQNYFKKHPEEKNNAKFKPYGILIWTL